MKTLKKQLEEKLSSIPHPSQEHSDRLLKEAILKLAQQIDNINLY